MFGAERSKLIEWLLEGDACIRYITVTQLQGIKEEEIAAIEMELLNDTKIKSLMDKVKSWPWPPLVSHKSAGHPLHKLVFLSELGIPAKRLGLEGAIQDILSAASGEGVLQVATKINGQGGSGKLEYSWALCDAPLMLYSLIKLGYQDHSLIQRGTRHLASLSRSNGFACAVSANLGKFRGPGRKEDPCPYATLIMLKLLAQIPDMRNNTAARNSADILLDLWEHSRKRHPYMFFMGTDFRKLKAPLVWYDIIHVADVLSLFPWVRKDDRFLDMIALIESKADDQGRYIPESVWQAWNGWDFGQKKEPSRGLTLMVARIYSRIRN